MIFPPLALKLAKFPTEKVEILLGSTTAMVSIVSLPKLAMLKDGSKITYFSQS
jgi:hypothetical protein